MKISTDKILSSLSKLDKAVLLLLSGASNAPIPGDTAYQKEIFFIANYDEGIEELAEFEPYYFGPFSEPAENSMEDLISYSLVENKDGLYQISEQGKELLQKIRDEKILDIDQIEDVKKFLNDMTHDERLLFTYANYPKYTEESKIRNEVLSKRIPISISLYKKGKIDLEMASHLSGLPMEDLLQKMSSKRVTA